MDDALEIYCDESGYTGPDLLQDQQPHFSYAGVALSLEEARDLIARIRRDHLIANPELKATDLIRTETGLHAMLDVLKAVEDRFGFVFFHKCLGLCGKVFEYLYKPVFQHAPELLYERNLHRFVAMFGLILHQGRDPFTTEALRQFQIFMRSRDLQLKTTIDELLANLKTRLDAEGKPIAVTGVATNTFDDFRDRTAYREMLKSARNAAKLDELHDGGDAQLIRLNFQATVVPDRGRGSTADRKCAHGSTG